MNKTDFISVVAETAGLTKMQAKNAVNAVVKTVEDTVKKGGNVALPGFGSFTVVKRAARMGINPRTKEPLHIPARKVVRFKPSLALAKVVE
jgi:DNA-binding protein HU-beta